MMVTMMMMMINDTEHDYGHIFYVKDIDIKSINERNHQQKTQDNVKASPIQQFQITILIFPHQKQSYSMETLQRNPKVRKLSIRRLTRNSMKYVWFPEYKACLQQLMAMVFVKSMINKYQTDSHSISCVNKEMNFYTYSANVLPRIETSNLNLYLK